MLPIELIPSFITKGWNNYSPFLFAASGIMLIGSRTMERRGELNFSEILPRLKSFKLNDMVCIFVAYQVFTWFAWSPKFIPFLEQYLKLLILAFSVYSWYVHFFQASERKTNYIGKILCFSYGFSLFLGILHVLGAGSLINIFYSFHKAGTSAGLANKVIFTFSEPSFVLPHSMAVLLLLGIAYKDRGKYSTLNIRWSSLFAFLAFVFLLVGSYGGSRNSFIGIALFPVILLSDKITSLGVKRFLIVIAFSLLILVQPLSEYLLVLGGQSLADPSYLVRIFRYSYVVDQLIMSPDSILGTLFGYGIGNLSGAVHSTQDTLTNTDFVQLSSSREFQSIVSKGYFDTTYSLHLDLLVELGLLPLICILFSKLSRLSLAATLSLGVGMLQFSPLAFPGLAIYLAMFYSYSEQNFAKSRG